MFVTTRISVILVFLFIGISIRETNGEKKGHIMFSRDHYEEERTEANRKIYEVAMEFCPNNAEENEKKIEEWRKCSGKIDEDNLSMCQVVEENLRTCMQTLFDYYETCVPENAKKVPTYVLDTAKDLTKYICDLDGAHLIELGNACILKKDHASSRICIRKLKREYSKYHVANFPEQEKICLFVKDFQECFNTHVDRFCLDPTTKEAYKGLYKQFLCEKH